MPNAEIIRAFLEQATKQGSRSTALKPLGWLVAMLLPATLASFYFETPDWLGPTLCSFTGLSVASYLGSYFYLLFKDKDALRSERYSLQKMAIEKGVYGDNLTGTIELDSTNPKLLSDQSGSVEEEPVE